MDPFAEYVFDTLREPLLVLDSDLCVYAANRAFYRTFQLDVTETVGERLYNLGNAEWDIPALRDLLENVLPKSTTVDDFEVTHTFEYIGQKVMLLNARKLFRPGNHVELLLLAIQDVTDQRRAELQMARLNEQLRERNREMEQFTYTVSHDLKSPLVTINGFVKLLEQHLDAGDTAQTRNSLGRVRHAAGQMDRLIDALLRLSRIGQGRDTAQVVDVNALLASLLESFAPRAEEHGCKIRVQPDLPSIHADPIRLEEVFDNLLSNALKYACPSGKGIEIGSEQRGGEIFYFVRDHGPGIPADEQKRIFGLFQRLDTKQEGTGVGLAVVEKVMQVHGGRAWVVSEEGKGATFYLAFPIKSRVNP